LTISEAQSTGERALGGDDGSMVAPAAARGRSTPSTKDGPARIDGGAAAAVGPVIAALLGPLPIRVDFWDGTAVGADDGPGAVHVRSPNAVRRILWAPGELGVSRAFVAGDLDFDGDVFELVAALRPAGVKLHGDLTALPVALRAARKLGVLARPLPAPVEETRPLGWRHSKRRDAVAVGHHYDVSNDFYRLVLGESMTYSCARFVEPSVSLEDAQAAKHELISRKLGLHRRTGMRLLDVGCGWGSMAIHAARHHGARVVGITISREQAAFARQQVRDGGFGDLIEIRLQDYRDLSGERFDAVSSIGMFEHVGRRRMAEYFSTLRSVLVPGGRLLNHAISSVGGTKLAPRSFIGRYVFPDGELIDVGDVALAMEAAGFEVRDVESLREHYARTLRHWVANLQRHWTEAVDLVGEGRARVWLLYMAASAVGFDDGGVSIHQVLGVVPDADGTSGMPDTRRDWS
jgi:cyclopropane-fatty-acyl-phospholipid synthase